jgi:hypothetical protein
MLSFGFHLPCEYFTFSSDSISHHSSAYGKSSYAPIGIRVPRWIKGPIAQNMGDSIPLDSLYQGEISADIPFSGSVRGSRSHLEVYPRERGCRSARGSAYGDPSPCIWAHIGKLSTDVGDAARLI